YASYRGWQMATEKVKPIPRQTARLDLTQMLVAHGVQTTAQAVDYLVARFMHLPIDPADRQRLLDFLNNELGTDQFREAESYAEEPLRLLLHLIMSLPEYQLGGHRGGRRVMKKSMYSECNLCRRDVVRAGFAGLALHTVRGLG